MWSYTRSVHNLKNANQLGFASDGVDAGQARVFICLQENIAKSGFGDQCKQQVQDREGRMQEDYRLDYGVASQCEADVNQYCSLEKVSMTT